jgi:RNA polymerase sigma factor (TIGR02999 family)
MGDVTLLLDAIRAGQRDPAELVSVVYEELRSMARRALGREAGRPSLQATDLVHDAYLRLLGRGDVHWESRAHFFASAAEAMRRILIERARSRASRKRGRNAQQVELREEMALEEAPAEEMLAVDHALNRLEKIDDVMGQVVKLRYFAGCSVPEVAEILQMSPRSVDRLWVGARAWLVRELASPPPGGATGRETPAPL